MKGGYDIGKSSLIAKSVVCITTDEGCYSKIETPLKEGCDV